jgi:hypothetical protein
MREDTIDRNSQQGSLDNDFQTERDFFRALPDFFKVVGCFFQPGSTPF